MGRRALATAVALAALALAGGAAAGSARLVVDASGEGDAEAQITQLRDAFGEPFEADQAPVEGALDYGFGPWGVTPPATLQQCSAQPLDAGELGATLATWRR